MTFNIIFYIIRYILKNHIIKPYYKLCEKWLMNNINEEVEFSPDVIQLYIDWFNELLSSNKKSLLKKIFNYV